jgi:hypothetical protein
MVERGSINNLYFKKFRFKMANKNKKAGISISVDTLIQWLIIAAVFIIIAVFIYLVSKGYIGFKFPRP